MSLSEIKNSLYEKEAKQNLSAHAESEFDAKVDSVAAGKVKVVETEDVWVKNKSGLNEKNRKILKTGSLIAGVIIGITLILVAVYQIRKSSFNESRVVVSIDGQSEAKSGKLLTYEISYNNNNWGSLKGAVLRITHPESFKPEESLQYREESPTVSVVNLDDLAGHATGKIIFGGRAFAPSGTLMFIKADLVYTPANFNSQFSANAQMGINVISTPMSLEIMAPQNLASGDSLDYQIDYKNIGAEDFENIRLKVDFQDGFIFSKANPSPSEGNNIWYIGHLSAGEEGKIIVNGKLQGTEGNIKKTVVQIGTINQGQFVNYNENDVSTEIVASPLVITQTVNGTLEYNADAGESLNFEIQYKNKSDIGLKNVIVKEVLDSQILDYSTLDMAGGSFDTQTKVIEWKSIDYPELANLAPGKGGSIKFSVKVKNVIPVQTVNDKNFVISGIARIDSPDIATSLDMNKIIAGNRIDIKLKSKLILDVKGYYSDLLISNFGPIPPIVGQSTSYTIHLKVGSVFNDITDGRVEVILPNGVVMTGKMYPEDSNLDYNERSNILVWNVGNVQAGNGALNSLREVSFQVKIKPSPNQADYAVELIKDVSFSAKDTFIKKDLKIQSGNKTTMLLEDKSINMLGWKVSK
ncbi:MAG: hypothetical protein UT50_C0002G0046 [Candidatus Moranbacteria bacterium GW2011_GWA2_39_41]|nr:MAG: hypothetical protein UT50_C0002G0046 [Candidatus Moranbacteria bacterium GW2011_GWA2_39_41]